ncbi:MAG: hypothetical protein NZO58_05245 [Gemmataceae bacterium]|nr:hypothetical protein [Gemmataceae bacterium]
MRTMPSAVVFATLAALAAAGDDPKPLQSPRPSVKNSATEFAEFSKLVHGFVISRTPKQLEHRDGWGETIPLGNQRLPLPNLRTYLKDGDRVVLPHGAWKRLKLQLDDPARDIKIAVKDFKPIDAKTYRLVLDADVQLRADGEWQQWQKGLLLIGVGVETDAHVRLEVGCDVGVELNLKKIPPEVQVTPKVTDLSLDLVDIRGRNGPIIGDEKLRNDVKNLLRSGVKIAEPQVKELVQQAVAQSLKDGKGTLSAAELLKVLSTKK